MSTLACPGVWALWPHTVIRDSALHASAVDTVGVHGRPPFISCPGVRPSLPYFATAESCVLQANAGDTVCVSSKPTESAAQAPEEAPQLPASPSPAQQHWLGTSPHGQVHLHRLTPP